MNRAAILERAAPIVFVVLWSTGFLGARGRCRMRRRFHF